MSLILMGKVFYSPMEDNRTLLTLMIYKDRKAIDIKDALNEQVVNKALGNKLKIYSIQSAPDHVGVLIDSSKSNVPKVAVKALQSSEATSRLRTGVRIIWKSEQAPD